MDSSKFRKDERKQSFAKFKEDCRLMEERIIESRKNVFTIDHEALFNGKKILEGDSYDELEIDELIDFKILTYFDDDPENYAYLQQLLLNIMRTRVDGYSWFDKPQYVRTCSEFESLRFNLASVRELHHFIFTHPAFPFGYREEAYKRHKKIMLKRHDDIKRKLLVPPNFKEPKKYGLKEIQEYLTSPELRNRTPRPKVMGKTLLLNANKPKLVEDKENGEKFVISPYEEMYAREIGYTKEFIINVTFMNHFDNVEHPLKYLLKWKEKLLLEGHDEDYSWLSIFSFNATLIQNADGYNIMDRDCAKYDIICFNFFELPIRDIVIETMMTFLLAFHKRHPNIYIKDVSGLGYLPYKKFSFYEELLASKIDVGV